MMAVAVADHLLDDAAVARAEVGIHAAAAADLFPHFLIGIFAGIAELDEPERGHAAGALRGELAVVVADGVDDLAVAVHAGRDAAAEMRDDKVQLLIMLAVLTRIAQVLSTWQKLRRSMSTKPVILATSVSSPDVTAS